MINPNTETHLQATIDMLNERHGHEWSFTILARLDRAEEDMDGSMLIVSNDDEPALVVGILQEIHEQGFWPTDQG